MQDAANLRGDEPNVPRSIEPAPTSTAAFVGCAPIGPTDRAMVVRSWSEYAGIFGGLDARGLLGYAASHFFDNGGERALIVRLAAEETDSAWRPTDPAFLAAVNADGSGAGGVPLLDQAEPFNLLAVPGASDPTLIAWLQSFCRERGSFLIADCDPTAGVADLPASSVTGPDAMNSALYFPWVMAPDPLDKFCPRAFPPSGFVVGIYARTDASRGVWVSPAGTLANIAGAVALPVTLDDAQAGQLTSRGVNSIRAFEGLGIVVWGARTLAGDDSQQSEWKYIAVRRLTLFIERSIFRGTKWAAFEPNAEPLWVQLRASIATFMQGLFAQGALQGATPRDAYLVRCDATTTTQADIDAGVVNIVVGFAPISPAEFVIISIRQLARNPDPDP